MDNSNLGTRVSSAAPMINTTANTGGPARPAAGAKTPAKRGGPSKATLGRVKLGAIAFSVVAFMGSLAGVIRATPNTVKAPVTAQPVVVAQAQPLGRPDQEAGLDEGLQPVAPRFPDVDAVVAVDALDRHAVGKAESHEEGLFDPLTGRQLPPLGDGRRAGFHLA